MTKTTEIKELKVSEQSENWAWLYSKTDLACPDCSNLLFFRKPDDYFYDEDSEPLFLDQVFCQRCNKAFYYIDAFFYDIPEKNKRKKIKETLKRSIQKFVNLFGYQISKTNPGKKLDLDLYPQLFSKGILESKCFYNIGSGSFSHPYWTNIDLKSDWYSSHHKKIDFINFDLLSLEPLPIETDKAELIYSRHVIEHLTNEAVQNMFNETYRILKPGGTFRFSTPDIDLCYKAYKRGDRHFFSWIDAYSKEENFKKIKICRPMNSFSTSQVFLYHFASQASALHTTKEVKKIPDAELVELFASLQYEDALDYCINRCRIDIQYDFPGNHLNWFNEKKARRMLEYAGFTKIYRSGYSQSFSPILRNTELFDTTNPKISLYMEAVK